MLHDRNASCSLAFGARVRQVHSRSTNFHSLRSGHSNGFGGNGTAATALDLEMEPVRRGDLDVFDVLKGSLEQEFEVWLNGGTTSRFVSVSISDRVGIHKQQ